MVTAIVYMSITWLYCNILIQFYSRESAGPAGPEYFYRELPDQAHRFFVLTLNSASGGALLCVHGAVYKGTSDYTQKQ